ncbi:hypothetical protein ACEN9X_17550 [Mucilaginibacter sp. Mucisp86]|uniref:hypothetical protein n=1 Tax=Mucilaginibacter sp. Mucisp86 TaxID=3243060 RepID=UPI0039B5A774
MVNISNKNSNGTRPTQPIAQFIFGGRSAIETNAAATEIIIPDINVRKAISPSDNESKLLLRFTERNICNTGAIRSISSGMICIDLVDDH